MSSSQLSFYDSELQVCLDRLDKLEDPLLKIDSMIDWSGLQDLMGEIKFDSDTNGKGGRKALCGLMIAKIFILQSLNNLSDDSVEYQINDRLSFKRFLGLEMSKKSPDSKTIWLWRERLKEKDLLEKIFCWFQNQLANHGFAAKQGQIIDASFVPTHKPTNKHKKQLEAGINLSKKQLEQVDNDATFTKKGDKTYHGYKTHIMIDNEHKFIRKFDTTTASLHDSQKLADLINENCDAGNEDIWADSAYRSADSEEMLQEKQLKSNIHERAYRDKPLTDQQKSDNKMRSKTRARVEHIFGHMVTSMGGLIIHTIGLARAKVKMTFKNLAYNIQRFAMLQHRKLKNNCA